jgi:exonuclease-1
MGIRGLLQFLKRYNNPEKNLFTITTCDITQLNGMTIAVDMGTYVHAHMSVAVKKVVQTMNPAVDDIDDFVIKTKWIDSLVSWSLFFAKMKCRLVLVFDGQAPPEKAKTQEARRKIRADKDVKVFEIMERINSTPPLERTEEMLEELRQAMKGQFDVPKDYIEELKDIFRACGYTVLQAVGEAEEACVSLERSGIVDLVLSNDSDCLAHGCQTLVTKILKGGKIEIVHLSEVLDTLKMDFELFLELCIASKCDYNDGVPKAQITTLERLLRKHGSYDRMVKLETKYDFSGVKMKTCKRLFSPKPIENVVIPEDLVHLDISEEPYYECRLEDLLRNYNLEGYVQRLTQIIGSD